MRPRLAIGSSDFAEVRETGAYYVDKTGLIRDVIESSAKVLFFPRPRRFGKTLNLSTLRCFFERSNVDRTPLFEGLEISRAGESYQAHIQRYPVIFLTFKDTKARSWDECRALVAEEIIAAFWKARPFIEASGVAVPERATIDAIVERRANEAILSRSLRLLSDLLARAAGEKVVILIDEYDTPIHSAFVSGYEREALDFFRNFLSSGLKDNEQLFRGVITGILRVARESLFSGLNNLAVYSILRSEMSDRFGFTEPEVEALASASGGHDLQEELRAWYDGYRFGPHTIYNPWSVLSFIDSEDRKFRPYWVSTASDDIVRDLLTSGNARGIHADLEVLLGGGVVEKPIEESTALRDVATRPDAVWSILLFSGYLRAGAVRQEGATTIAALEIPNREVHHTYETVFRAWLGSALGGSERVEQMAKALLAGDAEELALHLTDLMTRCLSYHDTSGPEVEKVYQAFIVGILVHLEPHYAVRSNRESGHGRYDIMILPKTPGKPGVVLELKTIDTASPDAIDKGLEAALHQIQTRNYASELQAHGATPIHELAAVFDGKKSWARARHRGPQSP